VELDTTRLDVVEVVETKIAPPPLPPSMLPRWRLVRAIETGLDRGIVLITAPAGFGKTTSAADWARRHTGGHVAWLSLTADDNQPARFWADLVEAIAAAEPSSLEGTRKAMSRGRNPSGQQFFAHLVNELCAVTTPTTLVLDNMDVLTDRDLIRWLTYVLQAAPPTVRFVLCSRTALEVPLGTWRAKGHLAEITAADLRMTDDEALTYLDPLIAGELSDSQLTAVLRQADGWVAGLYLAALGVLSAPDPAAFVDDLVRRGEPIADYLVGEVLNSVSNDVRTFLLETSILDRMSGAGCDAVTQRQDGDLTLAMLSTNGLFVDKSDHSDHPYRYHPLFRTTLRSLARDELGPQHVVDLHQRAVAFNRRQGALAEAIRHAIDGEAFDLARDMIENEGRSLLWEDPRGLSDLLARLPADIVDAWPVTRTIEIWAAGVRADLPKLEALLGRDALLPPHYESFEPAVRSVLSYLQGDVGNCNGAEGLPRQLVALGRGLALTLDEQYEAGAQVLLDGLADESEDPFCTVAATSVLAWNRVRSGRLWDGSAYASRALEIANHLGIRWFHGVRWAEIARAQVEFDRGQLDAAYRHILPVIEDPSMELHAHVEAHIVAARVMWSLGDRSAASEYLAAAAVAPSGPVAGAATLRISLAHAQFSLADRDLEIARAWLPDWEDRIAAGPSRGQERLVLARFLIAAERYDEARALLAEPLPDSAPTVRYGIEAAILDGVAAVRCGDPKGPMLLELAHSMAQPEAFARAFLDDAAPLTALGSNGGRIDSPIKTSVRTKRATTLAEPLTDREMAVLRLLPTRMSNKEIAAELFISVNTVKSHVKAIYRKLDVKSRNEAVTRAAAQSIA
jgi:LuxR family maltose regulon positive regulatory protein